jgi:hypothetical protein
MKLVMIEMMGGTRSFVGSDPMENETAIVLKECVEIKEVIAPGPQGPMCYHIGVKIGTLVEDATQGRMLTFDLANDSPLRSCYNSAMNAAIEKPTGGQVLHYGKAGQA